VGRNLNDVGHYIKDIGYLGPPGEMWLERTEKSQPAGISMSTLKKNGLKVQEKVADEVKA